MRFWYGAAAMLLGISVSNLMADVYQPLVDAQKAAGKVLTSAKPELFPLANKDDESALAAFFEIQTLMQADYLKVPSTWAIGATTVKSCMATTGTPGALITFYEQNCKGFTVDQLTEQYLIGYAAHFKDAATAGLVAKGMLTAAKAEDNANIARYRQLLLCEQVRRGNLDEATKLTAPTGPNVPDTVCADGDPVLLRSIKLQYWSLAKFFLDRKATPDLKDAGGRSALQVVPYTLKVSTEQKDVVKALLAGSTKRGEIITDGIRLAVAWKDADLLKAALNYRAHTADNVSLVLAQALAIRGSGQNLAENKGRKITVQRTPDYDGATLLLDQKAADVNGLVALYPKAMKLRPLHRVVRETYAANADFLARLIKDGATLDGADDQGFTAADWAAGYHRLYNRVCTATLSNKNCDTFFTNVEKIVNPTNAETKAIPTQTLATAISHVHLWGEGKETLDLRAWCEEGLKECK